RSRVRPRGCAHPAPVGLRAVPVRRPADHRGVHVRAHHRRVADRAGAPDVQPARLGGGAGGAGRFGVRGVGGQWLLAAAVTAFAGAGREGVDGVLRHGPALPALIFRSNLSAAISRRSRAEHFALLRATPRGGFGGKRNGSPQLNSGRDYFGLIRNSARRFLTQQVSTCSEHSGRSSPKLTSEIRSAAMPWETR